MKRIAIIDYGFPEGGIAGVTRNILRYVGEHAPETDMLVYTDNPCSRALEDKVDILVECSHHEKDIDKVRKAGIKVIYAEHGMPFHEQWGIIDRRQGGWRRPWVKRMLWKLIYRKQFEGTDKALNMAMERTGRILDECDVFVVLCENYRKEIIEKLKPSNPEKIVSIVNPGLTIEKPTFQKEKSILFCGRLSHYDKRPDRLLRIWQKVQSRLPDYRLDIVGDGHERERLENLAKELGLERYTFHGYHSNPEPFYRKADILCLVSQMEGWPLCLTEAQAHGVIPVAFDCSGGVREILQDGNGFIVPPYDEDAFAQTLVSVAAMEGKDALRKKLAAAAGKHTADENGAAWLALFKSLV